MSKKMGTGSGQSQPRKAAAELKRHAVTGTPRTQQGQSIGYIGVQETGEAGGRQAISSSSCRENVK